MGLKERGLAYLDQKIAEFGYLKAVPRVSSAVLYAGDTDITPEIPGFVSYSQEQFHRLAIQNPWIYGNINLIAKRVALGTFRIQRLIDDEWRNQVNHEYSSVIDHFPNPQMGQYYIWYYQICWLLLQGEAYWIQFNDKTGSLRLTYPLPADRVEPIPDSKEVFSGFWYKPLDGYESIKIPREQIVYHRLPNIFDWHRGLSPLTAYLISLQLDQEIRKYSLDDYQQGLTLKHILSTPPELGDTDFLRFQAEIAKGQKSGKRFLTGRGGDVKALAISNARGYDEAVRKITREEADTIYGVYEALRKPSSLASATIAENAFIADTIYPLMVLTQEDHTVQQIIPRYGKDYRAMFDKPVVYDPKNTRAEEKQSWEVISLDEARKKRGLEPWHDSEIGQVLASKAGEALVNKLKVQPSDTQSKAVDKLPEELQDGVNQGVDGLIAAFDGPGRLRALDRLNEDAFDDDDIQLANSLAQQIAVERMNGSG